MTIDEFITKLATSGRAWRFKSIFGRELIRSPEGRCPVSAIAMDEGHDGGKLCYSGNGLAIGLNDDDAASIAIAADENQNADDSPEMYSLRQRLLKACNLAPVLVEDDEPAPTTEPERVVV